MQPQANFFRTFVHLVSQFSHTVVNRHAFRPLHGGGKLFLAHVYHRHADCLLEVPLDPIQSPSFGSFFFPAAAIICYPGLFKAHLAVEKLKVEMTLIKKS